MVGFKRSTVRALSTWLLGVAFIFLACESPRNQVYVAKYPDDKWFAVSFTFDDGCPSVFSKIVPILDRYNVKGTFFIIPGQVRDDQWQNWKALSRNGHEIGNHSMTHPVLTTLDSNTLYDEIITSKSVLQQQLGTQVLSFAPPGHQSNQFVDSFIIASHKYSRLMNGFCSWYGWTSQTKNEFIVNDIQKVIKTRGWFVVAAHGIGDGWEPIREDVLVFALDYLKDYEEIVVIDTFHELAAYKRAYESTTVRVADSTKMKLITLETPDTEDLESVELTIVVENVDFPTSFKVVQADSGKPVAYKRVGDNLYLKTVPQTAVKIEW